MNRRTYPVYLFCVVVLLGFGAWLNGSTRVSQNATNPSRLKQGLLHPGDSGGICTCGGGNAFGRFMYWVAGLRGTMLQYESKLAQPSPSDGKN